jgi:hypothetical protein
VEVGKREQGAGRRETRRIQAQGIGVILPVESTRPWSLGWGSYCNFLIFIFL